MSNDPFRYFSDSIDSPAQRAADVTPSDSTDLATSARSLWIGAAGDVRLTTVGGDTVTFVGCTGGSLLPVRAARVHATGTTATNIIALW